MKVCLASVQQSEQSELTWQAFEREGKCHLKLPFPFQTPATQARTERRNKSRVGGWGGNVSTQATQWAIGHSPPLRAGLNPGFVRNLNSDLKVYAALFVYNLVIGYLKAFDKKKEKPGLKSNQVLGTVLQCSYFSVFFFSVPS